MNKEGRSKNQPNRGRIGWRPERTPKLVDEPSWPTLERLRGRGRMISFGVDGYPNSPEVDRIRMS